MNQEKTGNNGHDLAAAFRGNGKRDPREQLEIAGTERPRVPDVEAAAEALREADAAVKSATEVRADRIERLIYALVDADVKSYRYTDNEGQRWTVKATDRTTVKVKVKRGVGE